ncbi:KATNB1-like protein 1 isoform X2 [Engraulis encrasicolus]|uniref:KATNB1-like protein 1 isoform X2 n=1 Tax=Engraulis encrasicolus TaxID=184585 RepID=UPI002FD7424E
MCSSILTRAKLLQCYIVPRQLLLFYGQHTVRRYGHVMTSVIGEAFTMSSEDHDDEGGYQSVDDGSADDEGRMYWIRFSSAKHLEVESSTKEETIKKRNPIVRSGNAPGRLKRVLSSKRKKHRPLTVSTAIRRKQLQGKLQDAAGGEGQFSSTFGSRDGDETRGAMPLKEREMPNRLSQKGQQRTEYQPLVARDEVDTKYRDFFKEVTGEHSRMTQVLSGRLLRLKIACSLWKRSSEELLTYLLRLEDISLLVDCLPIITKRLQQETSDISLGFCVELLPLVKSALQSPFEDYLTVALNWVQSVQNKWWPQFMGQCDKELNTDLSDRNIYTIRSQLQALREHASRICLFSGNTGKIAKSVQASLVQLPR